MAAGAEAADQLAQRGEGIGAAAVDKVHASGGADPDRVEILDVSAQHARQPVGAEVGAVPLVDSLEGGQRGLHVLLFAGWQGTDGGVVGGQA